MSGIVSGKLALVTGGGSGIGRAACKVLAREGATVIAVDRNLKAAEETVVLISNQSDSRHCSIQADVGKSQSVTLALHDILSKYGKPPSIIANCAGITKDNFLLKMSEEDFDEVLNVNLKGTFLITKTFTQAIIDKGISSASIINISSIVAKNGNIGQCNYSASKAGVELLTKTAAKEFGKFGIRCNIIQPGFINTPIIKTIPDDLKNKFLSNVTCKRVGNPEEVAEVIAFLASEKSMYVNGACIEVSGGLLNM